MIHQSGFVFSVLKDEIIKSVKTTFPNSLDMKETEILTKLCFMGVLPIGTEDPKTLIRSLSNQTINKLISQIKSAQIDPIVGPISQLFLMEWFHRSGRLDSDWTWNWDTQNEGHIKFSSEESIDKLMSHALKVC